MPAGVHDRDGFAGWVGRGDGAGVRGVGLFADGQGVELGAEEESFAFAVLHDRDDAVAADVFGHVVTGGAKLLREAFGGLFFLEGELGVGVDGGVELIEGSVFLVD